MWIKLTIIKLWIYNATTEKLFHRKNQLKPTEFIFAITWILWFHSFSFELLNLVLVLKSFRLFDVYAIFLYIQSIFFLGVSMGWWLWQLTFKILANLRLTVNFSLADKRKKWPLTFFNTHCCNFDNLQFFWGCITADRVNPIESIFTMLFYCNFKHWSSWWTNIYYIYANF